ncbi:EpsG family protein [uncultured Slackia sp.]|uniref:EpsG family protein n=1 Tax=uncultured Slackia sp. TaxID=665903 RepID=UPI0025F2C6E5|nr:EpsG family protein [uncultured Slackia sp.]
MNSKIIEMAIAWLFIAIVVIIALCIDRIDKKRQSQLIAVCIISTSLMMSFRTLGLDLANYQVLYTTQFVPFWFGNGINDIFSQQYEAVNYIMAQLFGASGFRLYLFAMNIIPQILVYMIVRKQAHPFLYYAPFILYYLFLMDQVRQFFAGSFVLLSLFAEGALLSLIVLCGIAFAHFGSIPAMVIGIFKNKMPSQVFLLFLAIFIFICGYVISQNSVDSGILGRLSTYFDDGFSVSVSSLHDIVRLLFALYGPVTLTIFFISNTRRFVTLRDSESSIFKSAFDYQRIAGVIFFALFFATQSEVIAPRLFNIMSFGSFILIGKYLEMSKKKSLLVVLLWLVSIDLVATLYYFSAFVSWS